MSARWEGKPTTQSKVSERGAKETRPAGQRAQQSKPGTIAGRDFQTSDSSGVSAVSG